MNSNFETNNDEDNEILAYLARHGVVDKDSHLHKKRSKRDTQSQSRKGQFRYTIDLHGLTSDIAVKHVRNAMETCRARGIKELLIIHGQGYHSKVNEGPVLKRLVQDMLENELCMSIRDSRIALPKDGGDGATVVVLR